MRSSKSRRRRAGAIPAALACLALPTLAGAQQPEPEPEPDPEPFAVLNTGREIPGSLDEALEAANAGSNTANVVQFDAGLEFLTLTLETEPVLPAIDLQALDPGVDRSVDLDATGVTSFEINTASDVGPGFTLLHVKSGTATLVNLDISGSAVDDDEDETPLRAQFLVDAGATLGFRYDGAHLIEDNITGDGAVVKEGAETLRLLGTNDYQGGTEVEEGELLGNRNSLQGNIVVKEDAQLSFEDLTESATHLYTGEVSGKGKVVKQGDHILQFGSGLLAVTGGIEIRAGTLSGDTATISGDVTIDQGALFQLSQTNGGEYAGNITGAGKLEKAGTADLTLSGANSFSGGIELVTGNLIGNSASIPGNIELTNTSSHVQFVQSAEIGDGTHSGDISGQGKLIKSGPGTLTLTGTSTHTGDTTVEDGTLRGDTANLVRDIFLNSDTATVEFDHEDAQTFRGIISLAGNFIKAGGGTLTLTDGQTYSGSTEIRGGTLRMERSQESTSGITVAAGASFENASSSGGIVINGELVNRGRVVLGGANARVRVSNGGARFESGSALAVTLNDQGQSSELRVDNQAELDGLEIALTVEPGNYDNPLTYSVIFASSFVEGPEGLAFTTPEFAFLDVGEPTLTADGPNEFRLTLKLTPNMDSLVGFAQTANQRATGSAMDTVLASGSADADEIGQSFSVLSISQVPGVLDQLAGESLGAFTNPRQANARALAQALSRRFTANEYAAGPVSAGSSRRGRGSDGVRAAAAAGGASGYRSGWLEAVGLFSDQSGEINASDIRSQSGGLIGGFDAALPGMPRARLGMGFGYTRYSLDGNRGLSAEGNTYQAALYGSYERGRYYLGVAGRYAYTNMETERHIAFEAIDRRAEARTSGDEAGFLLEAGARLGDPTRLAYRPLVRLEYNHLDQGALRETGAGDLSLSADSLSANSWQTTLGVRVSTLFTLDGEFGIEPELRAGWTHSFGDLARPVAARFYAVPGAQPFVTYGAQNDPDHLFVGAGYLMRIGEVPLVGLDYDFYAGDGYHLHVASAQLYLRW